MDTHSRETPMHPPTVTNSNDSDSDTTQNLILQCRIDGPPDMLAVEAALTQHLGGEGHRCAFLRSKDYIRIRLAALYPTFAAPPDTHPFPQRHRDDSDTARVWTAYVGRLCLTLRRDPKNFSRGGAIATIRSVDPFVYSAPQEATARAGKRARGEGEMGVVG